VAMLVRTAELAWQPSAHRQEINDGALPLTRAREKGLAFLRARVRETHYRALLFGERKRHGPQESSIDTAAG
jgi:hypothetical protein